MFGISVWIWLHTFAICKCVKYTNASRYVMYSCTRVSYTQYPCWMLTRRWKQRESFILHLNLEHLRLMFKSFHICIRDIKRQMQFHLTHHSFGIGINYYSPSHQKIHNKPQFLVPSSISMQFRQLIFILNYFHQPLNDDYNHYDIQWVCISCVPRAYSDNSKISIYANWWHFSYNSKWFEWIIFE